MRKKGEREGEREGEGGERERERQTQRDTDRDGDSDRQREILIFTNDPKPKKQSGAISTLPKKNPRSKFDFPFLFGGPGFFFYVCV